MHVDWHMTSLLFCWYMGGPSPKVYLPCLMHKARVVTVLLFASQKMVEVAAALVGFCVGSVLVWAELLSP